MHSVIGFSHDSSGTQLLCATRHIEAGVPAGSKDDLRRMLDTCDALSILFCRRSHVLYKGVLKVVLAAKQISRISSHSGEVEDVPGIMSLLSFGSVVKLHDGTPQSRRILFLLFLGSR